MIDANNPAAIVEDLRGSNVRHHHMPCNTNSGMRSIVSNTGNFQPDTDAQSFTYYFAVGDPNMNDGNDGDGSMINNGLESQTIIMDIASYSNGNISIMTNNPGTNGYNNAFDQAESDFGESSTWTYALPTPDQIIGGANQIGNGYLLWSNGPSNWNSSGGAAEFK